MLFEGELCLLKIRYNQTIPPTFAEITETVVAVELSRDRFLINNEIIDFLDINKRGKYSWALEWEVSPCPKSFYIDINITLI